MGRSKGGTCVDVDIPPAAKHTQRDPITLIILPHPDSSILEIRLNGGKNSEYVFLEKGPYDKYINGIVTLEKLKELRCAINRIIQDNYK